VPKLKTHKGAAARFKVTGTGKILRMKGNLSHLRSKKTSSTKRLYSRNILLSSADEPRIRKLLN
jgi:large subunit ribosomal protein L35